MYFSLIYSIINLWKKSLKSVPSKLFRENLPHGLKLNEAMAIHYIQLLIHFLYIDGIDSPHYNQGCSPSLRMYGYECVRHSRAYKPRFITVIVINRRYFVALFLRGTSLTLPSDGYITTA